MKEPNRPARWVLLIIGLMLINLVCLITLLVHVRDTKAMLRADLDACGFVLEPEGKTQELLCARGHQEVQGQTVRWVCEEWARPDPEAGPLKPECLQIHDGKLKSLCGTWAKVDPEAK